MWCNSLQFTLNIVSGPYLKVTRNSAITDKQRDTEVIQGHKHGTIPYVKYGFLLVFYSNFVPKMHGLIMKY